MKPALVILISLCVVSCSDPPGKNSDLNSSPNNVSPNNVSPNNISPNNANQTTALPVTLELVNATDTPALLFNICDAPSWLVVRDELGDTVRRNADCAICECNSDSCSVCGACRAPTEPIALAPGAALESTWDGRFVVEPGGGCYEWQAHASGMFTAEFCFGWTAGGQGSVTDRDCHPIPFELGVDERVTYTIEEAPDPVDPACAAADSNGFFPNCDVCDEAGTDCDTIDAPGASGNACGCSGGCPCGLSCGSYEIAPNITVSGICVR